MATDEVECSLRSGGDWKSLFASSKSQSLDFFPPLKRGDSVVVQPPAEVFEIGEQVWSNSLVAQFLERPPNFSALQKILTMLWGKTSGIEVKPAGNDLFVVKFQSEDARNWVIENGPWHVMNKPVIVRKWEPGLQRLDFGMNRLPVWVHLYNVPLDLYHQTGLSWVASAIGTPLYMDSITSEKSRLSYAKVCVEIDASDEIKPQIEVVGKYGNIVTVNVEVPWMPRKCSSCQVFGHADKGCPKRIKVVQKWVPKDVKKKDIDGGLESADLEAFDKGQDSIVDTINVVDLGTRILVPDKNDADVAPMHSQTMDKSGFAEVLSGSANRFAVIETVQEAAEDMGINEDSNDEDFPLLMKPIPSPRKKRAAAAGVAEVLKKVNDKKKHQLQNVERGKRGKAITPTGKPPSLC